MSDHKMLPLILEAIEEHGPMTCEQIGQFVPLSATAIYRNCKLAVDMELLSCRRINNGKTSGRRLLKFYSNQTRFDRRAKAEQERLARWRAESEARRLERERLTNFKPFRHWQDVAFYGEYGRAA